MREGKINDLKVFWHNELSDEMRVNSKEFTVCTIIIEKILVEVDM